MVSALGWGTHSLAPLSYRVATYSGVFTLYPLLTGKDRAHHAEMLVQEECEVQSLRSMRREHRSLVSVMFPPIHLKCEGWRLVLTSARPSV